MKTAQLAALCFTCLLGILPVAASAEPYIISADGSEVTDRKTRLIWRRCAEDMNWDGSTCAGVASTFTHKAALERAATQASSTGLAWRLPNVKDLASIADRSRINPAIDPTAFPVTPASWFWSSSPYIGFPTVAWLVFFGNGNVYGGGRSNSFYVRLVRARQ